MPRYNPAVVEAKWQKYWETNNTFAAPRLPTGPKAYVLDMFPYPSGDGLHVGHPEGYTATDIVCRYRRMRGAACCIRWAGTPSACPPSSTPSGRARIRGQPPRRTSHNFRRQLKMLGFSYDWDRELATTDVGYFRWTQWIFLVLFDTWFDPRSRGPADRRTAHSRGSGRRGRRRGRALSRRAPAGLSARGPGQLVPGPGHRAGQRGGQRRRERARRASRWCGIPLRQWMLRITAYADRLENDLDGLDWPESIKLLQRNWIGRSTGAEVDFFIGTFLDAEGRPSQREYRRLAGWTAARPAFPKAGRGACCGSTPPGPTRSSAPPTWSSPRSIRSSSG